MRILGIDPGYAIVGWGAIEKNKGKISILSYDAITSSKTMPFEQRLVSLYNDLGKILKLYTPDVVVIEQLFFNTNAKTAILVAQARGVIIFACAQKNIPVVSYSPLNIKLTLTGNGRADKKQVQHMLMRELTLPSIPKPDDVADALAIALTHAYTKNFK